MTKSSAPNEQVLRQLYKQHNGVIAEIARSQGWNRTTTTGWLRDLNLNGIGRGAPVSRAPSEERLRQLYDQFDGNLSQIAHEIKAAVSAVHKWYRKLGLQAKGRQQYSRIYPRELRTELNDGFLVAFSDCHWWEKEKSNAHLALLEIIKKLKPKIIVANGDVLDGARISRHDPSGMDETPTLEDELRVVTEHLAEIRRASSGAEAYFCWGNHDARFSHYIARKAPELMGIGGTRLDHHILGWQFCWSVRISDDLLVMHKFRSGKHAPYNNVLNAGINIATGHLHAQKVYPVTNARTTMWGIDLGCIADPMGPQFGYAEASVLDWRSGFGIFEFKGGKMLPPQLVTVLPDGSVWRQKSERIV